MFFFLYFSLLCFSPSLLPFLLFGNFIPSLLALYFCMCIYAGLYYTQSQSHFVITNDNGDHIKEWISKRESLSRELCLFLRT